MSEYTAKKRLTRAFERLRRDGFVARQRWKCCQTCGFSEINLEIGTPLARGIVFYHQQDVAKWREGADHLYLAFAHPSDEAKAAVEVGWKVCRALGDVGLTFEWDGTSCTRIKVEMGEFE
jgi:hypothetical protein